MGITLTRKKDDALSQALETIDLLNYIIDTTGQSPYKEGDVYVFLTCPMCGGGAHMKVGRNAYKTFAECGRSGSLVDYLMETESITTGEAIKKVFQIAKTDVVFQINRASKATKTARNEQPSSEPANYDFVTFVENAHNKRNRSVYFNKRGLSAKTIQKFKLGYSADGLNGLGGFNVLESKKYFYKRYKNIIPFLDEKGVPYYLQPRINPEDLQNWKGKSPLPKAMNLPNLKVPLYNEYYLKIKPSVLYVVEGPIDALSIEDVGFPCLALCGVGNFRKLIQAIKEEKSSFKNTRFILLPDNDEAGKNLISTFEKSLEELSIQHEVLILGQEFRDANDALVQDREYLEEVLRNKQIELENN